MSKDLSGFLRTLAASAATLFFALTFAGCDKIVVEPSFVPKFQDSLEITDLEWLNNYVSRTDSIGMITGIERLDPYKEFYPHIRNKYLFYITQPIDHKDLGIGTFKQMVVVEFAGYDRPVDIVTEGYQASSWTDMICNEISTTFKTNVVAVEHRYFGHSVPFAGSITDENINGIDWNYLSSEQEAADLHAIREKLGQLFKGSWVASGASKGGENCMSYTAFYPQDLACSVPYVGPVCNGVDDDRMSNFARDSAMTSADREKVVSIQRELLRQRKAMMPLFEDCFTWSDAKTKISYADLYDYWVLDFALAFYQYHSNLMDKMPDISTATVDEIFTFASSCCPPTEFVLNDGGILGYYVQAAKELGYYSYDIEPFKDLLTITGGNGILDKLYTPAGTSFTYDGSLNERLYKFLSTTKSRMMFIYGANDPWTACRPISKTHDNLKLYIVPDCGHNAKLTNMPPQMKQEAVSTLSGWLGVSAL
jgi:pimeloyl-ACP methyl ester carboxylesterase